MAKTSKRAHHSSKSRPSGGNKGPAVTSRKQAIAIALSESRRRGGGRAKVEKVMHEFKAGTLHSGGGHRRRRH